MSGRSVFIGFFHQALKKKPGKDPAGQVVQADDFFNIPFGTFVIPGAEFAAHSKGTGDEFSGENEKRIQETAHEETALPDDAAHGGQKGGHAIYGKHPDGGVSV